MENEIWKDVPGYEGLYRVSNYGQVKRLIGIGCKQERILKFNKKSNQGHLQVDLSKNGERKKILVHRLVLKTFMGKCPNKMECRHLDGNPRNNRLDNLKWGTKNENTKDSIEHKRHWFSNNRFIGSGHPMAKLNEYQVLKIKKLLKQKIFFCQLLKP
jgi:hypothetical protein